MTTQAIKGDRNTRDPSEALRRIITLYCETLYTSMPGIALEGYNKETRRVSVRPAIQRSQRVAGEPDAFMDRMVIPNVPVLFPSWGGFSVHGEIQAGDAVDLIFSMRSTAEFKKAIANLPTEYPQGADGSVAPFPDRMMDRLDVVAVPGYYLADEDRPLGTLAISKDHEKGSPVEALFEEDSIKARALQMRLTAHAGQTTPPSGSPSVPAKSAVPEVDISDLDVSAHGTTPTNINSAFSGVTNGNARVIDLNDLRTKLNEVITYIKKNATDIKVGVEPKVNEIIMELNDEVSEKELIRADSIGAQSAHTPSENSVILEHLGGNAAIVLDGDRIDIMGDVYINGREIKVP